MEVESEDVIKGSFAMRKAANNPRGIEIKVSVQNENEDRRVFTYCLS